MRKNTKKIIALLMAITMIIALFPMNVFAQTDIVPAQTDSSVIQSADNKETETALDEDGSAQTAQPEAEATQTEAEAVSATDTADEVVNYSASAVNSLENPLDFSAKGAKTTSKSKARSASVVSASVDLLSGEGTAQQPYLIQSASDWDALSDYINNGGTEYNGKHFKLTDNITVTTVLGIRPGSSDSADRPFVGTFNGAGHTLTVNYNKSGFVAPFAIAHNSTIENLKVKGTVKSTDNHASGLVGASKDVRVGDASYLNIKNVTISTDISCNSHVAGVIGHAHSATITMENVVFNGSISASSVQGGFIGWGGANQGRLFNCTLKDCLFAGTYRNGAAFNPVAYASGQGNVVLTNDFYTTKSASGGSPITPTGSGAVKLVVATVEKDGQVNYFDNITTAVNSSNWTVGSTLKLLTDVTTSNTITVPSGAHSLELNGFVIKSSGNGSVFKLGNGSIFNLYDNDSTTYSRNKYHSFSTSSRTFSGQPATCYSYSSSSASAPSGAYVEGGLITGGYGSTGGGGVLVDSGATFNMYGGNIAGNCHYTDIDYHGGGIDVKSNSTFNMYGGAVRYNTGIWGGGVNIYGTMNMSEGAVISDNIATKGGAGIEMENGGRLYMNGGTVTNNRIIAQNGGMYKAGGIHVPNGAELHVKGKVIVKDNYQGTSGMAQNNVFVRKEVPGKVILDSALTSGAYIGVSTNGSIPFTITSNYNTYNGSDLAEYFTSDNSEYSVFLNSDGEAQIGVPPVASIISGETVTNYSSLAEAVNAWLAGSTLKLMSDVTTANTITVPSGEHTLDLNGHELKRTGATGSDNSGLVITVGDGVNLTVTGPGKITGGNGFHGGGIHVEGNSSLVLDNCEISGNTGHYGGGLYLKNGTITLKNGTAVKNNSATEGFGGSGIYAEGSGTLILEGGTFTNNEIRNNNQYAVFLAGNANAQISGAPVIYDNKYGSTQKNLYMFQAGNQHSIVRIAGALTDGAKIGVGQTTVTGEITSGWKDKMGNANPAEYFTSDNSEYSVFLNSDGEAEIGYPPIPDVSSEGFEGDYDAQPHSISVSAPEGTTIKYGTEEGSYVLDKNPSYTDAGTYTVYYEVSQAKHTSVTGSQTVVINQIDATVTVNGHNTTVDYDGEAHSIENYDVEISNPLYSESDFTFNGRAEAVRTNAGTTNMGLSAEQFVNTNSNFATVTFEITDGYLTVNPINASVTITGHNATVDYNGKAQSADGYDVQIDNPLYKESDFKFNGRAEAVRTDVGTTNMGLSAEQFENISENFATVTFDVTDGYITVNKVDAVIKTAPHAKSTLDYNGKSQSLCVAGVVDGGTLYYALGKNDKTVPANSQFKTSLPVATEIGNYYIWYKVKADKNHYDISADCFKVTLANKEWVTISGKIYSNDKKPLDGAEVILMSGNDVVDTIKSYENGEYYFTVPKGVYNIVVKYKGLTVTNIADISSDKVENIVMSKTNTDSVLDIQSSDKNIAVGGLEQEADAIRRKENIPDDVNVTVKMTVKAVAQNDTDGAKLITDFAKDKYIEFYNLDLQKIIGSESTRMDKTQNVLEIVIPCSFVNKRELAVYSCDGSSVSTFTLSDSKQAGTFRVDVENGLVYIYADSFNTLAIAYQPYFSVLSDISLGAYEGNVSVKLTKDNDSSVVYELSDVSLQNISFTGVPRGTYTMTVSWIDGVENTLTLPFNIK